ncbi:MAG TPA: 4-hydroxyproline epimerase [Acidobacteriaceae bacterium]|jgi:4-hydroxyproline epimerase|nr:4-hydroxyproline epimerase [Acidobacteriaceae bacterium]
MLSEVQVVDSHTAGEPTRVVVGGGPDLGAGSLAERRQRLARDHDDFRSAVVNEPRGSDVLVGALLVEPVDAACAAGVIFFNNVGMLGMCGHGTIGLVTTLAHLGRIGAGEHRIETPVGTVKATLRGDGRVTVENVPSYRYRKGVSVEVPGFGAVTGDVAWGGNWFFLAEARGRELALENREALTQFAVAIRGALNARGITGPEGTEIDHVELFGPSPDADSRNFVLCPGHAYDRSPCGTGTSAKLACLAADGKLAPGAIWRQEGILGTVFEGSYRSGEGEREAVIPSITGSAYITGESRLLFERGDPFRMGIPLPVATTSV